MFDVTTMLSQSSPEELLEACGPEETRGNLCEWSYNLTSSTYVAETMDALSKPLRVIGIILAAYLANRIARYFIRRSVVNIAKDKSRERMSKFKKRTGLSKLETSENTSFRTVQRAETIGTALKGIATFTIVLIAILLIIQTYGVDLGPILAGAGLIGVALGFGAQTMVRDFLAGFFLIIEDWYGVGDVIDAGEASGTVEQVTLRATRLRDVYGVVWHIPNGEIRRAGNKSQQWARALLDIGVALETDIDFAQDIIRQTAEGLANDPEFATEIMDEPEVWGVEEIAADRIIIRVVIKTNPSSQWKIARELRARVKAAFDENSIAFPPVFGTKFAEGTDVVDPNAKGMNQK
jgi:small-conductance mechanosensitive channel